MAIRDAQASTASTASTTQAPKGRPAMSGPPKRPQLVANTIKATIVLRPEDVLRLGEPLAGTSHVALTIAVAGRVLQVSLNTKGVRRARKTIQEAGPDGVACILQGKLALGDVLEEAGLSAQPKSPQVRPGPQTAVGDAVVT